MKVIERTLKLIKLFIILMKDKFIIYIDEIDELLRNNFIKQP